MRYCGYAAQYEKLCPCWVQIPGQRASSWRMQPMPKGHAGQIQLPPARRWQLLSKSGTSSSRVLMARSLRYWLTLRPVSSETILASSSRRLPISRLAGHRARSVSAKPLTVACLLFPCECLTLVQPFGDRGRVHDRVTSAPAAEQQAASIGRRNRAAGFRRRHSDGDEGTGNRDRKHE